MADFTAEISISLRWKIDAARTADAPPSVTASTQWFGDPAPPEAITATPTEATTALVSSMSKPSFVPSVSIDVRRISPAPRSVPSLAHSSASRPVGVRPPLTTTSKDPFGVRRASMARTTHWLPNRSAHSVMRSGRRTAAVLIPTLSAPALRAAFMSSEDRTPPPTVSGTNTFSAVRLTTSNIVGLPAGEAEMSR